MSDTHHSRRFSDPSKGARAANSARPKPALADEVLVLRTVKPGGRATKLHRYDPKRGRWHSGAYDAGKFFRYERRTVTGIRELGALVDELRSDSRALLIRGGLADHARELLDRNPSAILVRRKNADQKTPQIPPPVVEVGRSWVMLDVDRWPVPEGLDLLEDTDAVVQRFIAEELPPAFHDVECFWQLSASAGYQPGIVKAHLFFWLDRPIDNATLRKVIEFLAPAVDRTPFNAVQPHYIADPLVEGGLDPVSRRTGWLKGEDEVVVFPRVDLQAIHKHLGAKKRVARLGRGLSPEQANTVGGKLAQLGDGEGLGGFHEPLRKATWIYALHTPSWERDPEHLKVQLVAAIETAPTNPAKRSSVEEYLRHSYLDRLIDGAFTKIPEAHKRGWESTAPEYRLPRMSRTEGETAMSSAIRAFLESPRTPDQDFPEGRPRQGIIAAELGIGKSFVTLQELHRFIKARKAERKPWRVLYLIPEHALGKELHARALELRINAAIWRGRKHVDRTTNEAMCLDPEAVEEAEKAQADIRLAVCGAVPGNEPCCRFALACRFNQQRKPVASADLVIAAHNLLSHTLPTELERDLALVVIDESFWQTFQAGVTIDVTAFARGLEPPVLLQRMEADDEKTEMVPDIAGTHTLGSIRKKVERAISVHRHTYLERRFLTEAGLTREDCETARTLEWRRYRQVRMRPGMRIEERRRAGRDAAFNAQLPCLAAFWESLGTLLTGEEEATGRVELETVVTENRERRSLVHLHLLRRVIPALEGVPMLMLDATGDLEIVQQIFPEAELLAEVRCRCPHQRVHQITGPFSMSSFRNRRDLLERIRDFVALKSAGEPTLVVTNLEFEDVFRHDAVERVFDGMQNVQVAHYGAVAGRNDWAHVRHIFLVGRPQAGPEDNRAAAASFSGQPIPRDNPSRVTQGVLMAHGGGGGIDVSAFANSWAERLRRAVTGAAVVQAGGRGRGVRRTSENPLDIWILANVATPYPLDELARWEEIAPGQMDRMRARGLELASGEDANAIFPDLFSSAEAFRQARTRDVRDSPLQKESSSYKAMSRVSRRITYKPLGGKKKPRQVRLLLQGEGGPEKLRVLLTRRVGDLRAFEVGDLDSHHPHVTPVLGQPVLQAVRVEKG